MHVYVNKNKKQVWMIFIGLVLGASLFLAYPFYISAQETNTNTSTEDESTTVEEDTTTNTESNTTETTTDDKSSLSDYTWEEGSDDEETIRELTSELDEKRAAIEELNKKSEIYEQNIKVKQQEAITLNGQMAILDLQISQTELDIETVREEIDSVGIEIERLELEIAKKINELGEQQDVLAAYIRLINKYDEKTYLEIFIANESFSDFYDQLEYAQTIEGSVESTLVGIRDMKESLEQQKTVELDKQAELEELTGKLAASINGFSDQKVYKEVLLDETEESESKFEALLEEARREHEAVASEISSLETKARERLQEEGIDLDIDAALMWPINPAKGISAYFHDPTYPFRKYFEHPAIDLPTSQGTAVRAAENGYVVRAKNAGLGYSYVMLVHSNELSTVYGHLSRIDVAEDEYVVRGQQIGISGGLPGTPGAGRLSTGAHLHFEVRFDGIPVNPLDYLPGL